MKQLLIGAALLALAAGPLAAQGHGNGKGQAAGHGNSDHGSAMKGPAMKGPAMHGPSMRGSEMHGPAMKERGHGKSGHAPRAMTMQAAAPGHGQGHAKSPGAEKHKAAGPKAMPGRSAEVRVAKPADRAPGFGNGNGHGKAHVEKAAQVGRGVKALPDGRHYYSDRGAREAFDFAAVRRGLIDDCPPGLAKKYNGCLPPGRARQQLYQPAWWGLAGLGAGSYVYDDGYLMRLNGDRVAGYVPLLGGALFPGNIWPSGYAATPVPDYYDDYYDLGPPDSYRYADDVLYRIDPSTSAITSIAGLLTGDTFDIGSPMPPGYDVYNVPYAYRDQYVDGPDARYRYSDGYIYQVDPTTQLVTAAIDLLTG